MFNNDKEFMVDPPLRKNETKQPVGQRCIVISITLIAIAVCVAAAITVYFTMFYQFSNDNGAKPTANPVCYDPCVLTIVESIPENLTYKADSPVHLSTYEGLMKLMESAQETIEIASFYWTLRGTDLKYHDHSSWQGESVFNTLMSAGKDRHLKIKIVQNKPDPKQPNLDTPDLAKYANADVRTLDVSRLLGSGILHTKMWLIDRKHFYVGSANLDWRSLTQVKELGSVVTNCSCMAEDMGKLFDAYWYLATPQSTIPPSWPSSYSTNINNNSTMQIKYNGTVATTYLSSSPPPFCASGRTNDIDAILSVISQSKEFIYIAVMDYFPTTQFTHPRKYWPVIDDALRRAAFDREIKVKLLISFWENTWKDNPIYLRSLSEMWFYEYPRIDLEVRVFVVPATDDQKKIPYARVNHNKYMVTDKTAYIGTSNWSGDYFIDTGGIALVVNQNVSKSVTSGNVRQQLEDIFLRDWYSHYSTELYKFNFTWPTHHHHSEL